MDLYSSYSYASTFWRQSQQLSKLPTVDGLDFSLFLTISIPSLGSVNNFSRRATGAAKVADLGHFSPQTMALD